MLRKYKGANTIYKLIIVEDEENIRGGIKSLIDWNDLGFEVVGDFNDGSSALLYLNENQVDVVLTDIKMKEVSGIELAKQIRERKLNIHVIVISGYRDFEYARSAIAYGVENYLLKPIKLDELYHVFKSVKQKMDEERTAAVQTSELKTKIDTAIPYIEEQLLYNLIIGAIRTEEQLHSRMSILGRNIFKDIYMVLVIEIVASNHWVYGKETLWTAILNIMKEMNHGALAMNSVPYDSDRLVVFITGYEQEKERFLEDVNLSIGNAIKEISQLLSVEVNIGRSGIYTEPLLAASAYYEARRLMSGIAKDHGAGSENSLDNSILKANYKNLMACIFQGDMQATENISEQIIDTLCIHYKDDIKIRNAFNDMITTIMRKIHENLPGNVGMEAFDCSILYLSDHILQTRKIVVSYFLKVANYFLKNKVKTDENLLLKAKKFIMDHYSEDISLNSVAEYVYLSPSHFSKIFKEYTGDSFIGFLTEIRMQKAKKLLLAKESRVYDIAEKIGYKSQKYFSRLFKQYTGLSPTEYQNINGEKSERL